MRTSMTLILTAAAMTAMSGCIKENMTDPENDGSQTMTISAVSEVDSKTSLHTDGKTILWAASDVLGLYDGGETIKQFTTTADDISVSGTSADFTGSADYQDMYYAIYPYSSSVSFDSDTKTFITNIPTTQTAVAGGFMPAANVAVAKADCAGREALIFKNICSYIKVEITESDVKKVVVKSTSGQKLLSGKAKVTVTDGDPETVVYDGSTLVYLVPSSGDYIAPGTYYIAVAPQTLAASEYTIRKVYDSTMKVWTGKFAFELKRNTPVNFGDLASANFDWENYTQVDLLADKNTEVWGANVRYTQTWTNDNGWSNLVDDNSGSFWQLKSSSSSNNTAIATGRGSWVRWDFAAYQYAFVFEYQTPTYWDGGYPTSGYNMIPWTLSLAHYYKHDGGTPWHMYKTLTVENDALPWESGQTYASDVITYYNEAATDDYAIRHFILSCLRTRTNAGPGVSSKDAVENVTFNDFSGSVAPASWALAELKLWLKDKDKE